MAPSLRRARRDYPKVNTYPAAAGACRSSGWIGEGSEGWCLRIRRRAGTEGGLNNCLLSVGMALMLVHCARAVHGKRKR